MKTRAEIVELKDLHLKSGFDAWVKLPVTRFMISLIPPCENKEVLETLLQSAYEAGFNAGGSSMAVEIIKDVYKDKGTLK